MAKLSTHFEVFHNKIKVDPDALVEKRDILFGEIKDYLKQNKLPSVELINQGSYIYGVGIIPTGTDEYDIDVGLALNILKRDYPDTKVVRKWILDAIEHHKRTVKSLNPCIRVSYAKGFHVDLVTYAKYGDDDTKEDFYLAFEKTGWKPSSPKKLKEFINTANDGFAKTKFNGVGSTQLQRIVRYLKRWNDLQSHSVESDKPTGIALLLLAIKYLQPTLDSNGEPDDLTALIHFLRQVQVYSIMGRIEVQKPTPEYEDVFKRITDDGMKTLKARLVSLKAECEKAAAESTDKKASQILAAVFGADFPVEESLTKSMALDSLSENDRRDYMKLEALKKVASGVSKPTQPWSKG